MAEKGSVEVGRRVRLPSGAERPVQVFINGLEQKEGSDYTLHGREIVFSRPLVKERVSSGRWLAMTLGLFGSYGEHDTVDLHFRRGGGTQVISDAKVLSGLMRVCLMIEGQESVEWDHWVGLANACEGSPIEALFRSDHYLSVMGKTDRGSLDAWTTICALAAITSTVHLGTLVSPVTFRHPSVLAKSIVTADRISGGGRIELGLGAGWLESEHRGLRLSVPANSGSGSDARGADRDHPSRVGRGSVRLRRGALPRRGPERPAEAALPAQRHRRRTGAPARPCPAARSPTSTTSVSISVEECRAKVPAIRSAWAEAGRPRPVISLMTGCDHRLRSRRPAGAGPPGRRDPRRGRDRPRGLPAGSSRRAG